MSGPSEVFWELHLCAAHSEVCADPSEVVWEFHVCAAHSEVCAAHSEVFGELNFWAAHSEETFDQEVFSSTRFACACRS